MKSVKKSKNKGSEEYKEVSLKEMLQKAKAEDEKSTNKEDSE